MFKTALLVRLKNRKQPIDHQLKWINKLWYSYIIEYYLEVKRNELPVHATLWMRLQLIMLNYRCQKNWSANQINPLIENSRKYKLINNDNRSIVALGLEWWEREITKGQEKTFGLWWWFQGDKEIGQIILSHTLNMCSSWHINHTSIKIHKVPSFPL